MTRLEEILDTDPKSINSDFSHIEHMYTGRFSDYYYQRFDQALEAGDLAPSDSVLIVGAGTGVFSLSVVQYVDDLHLTDLPREDPLFETVRSLYDLSDLDDRDIEYAAADATSLPYQSDTFDAVFALDVLEHIPEEQAAIGELARVTKSNGKTIVSAPIEIGPPLIIRELYRFIDGRRCQSESLSEFVRSIFGRSPLDTNQHHRGYDYRKTISRLNEPFNEVSVEYCPYKMLKWFNPTAIIIACF